MLAMNFNAKYYDWLYRFYDSQVYNTWRLKTQNSLRYNVFGNYAVRLIYALVMVDQAFQNKNG